MDESTGIFRAHNFARNTDRPITSPKKARGGKGQIPAQNCSILPNSGGDMRQTGEDMDMNQFAMWQVFCWSARVMCLCISPLPIQASRIGFASSPVRHRQLEISLRWEHLGKRTCAHQA